MNRMLFRRSALLAAGVLCAAPAAAQTTDAAAPGPETPSPAPVSAPAAPTRAPFEGALVAPRVDVLGTAPRTLDRVPGSATLVRREDLEQLAPQSASDVLRTVPGVNVVPEDGIGLRINVGIRGLDPNRSRQVLVLEDGVPVSMNPYGSPELYYSPPIERMDRVEVVRGSGQILWGPQTVGGVINYITRDPPRRPSAGIDLRAGNGGYLLAVAHAGATHGNIGWRIDAVHRRFDGPRALDLGLTDVSARLRLQLSPRSILGVKLNVYREDSASTYLGLTTPQLARDPTFNGASNDRFTVNRYALALTHQLALSGAVMLRTTLYAYQIERAWRRQEYDRTGALADYERACDPTGRCGAVGSANLDLTRDGGSVYFRRSAAIRDRVFGVFGIEPRLTWAWHAGDDVQGELTGVVRFHTERADDQLRISSLPTVNAGVPIDAEFRTGYAVAAAVQHRFTFWDRLTVTPGLRVESFWSERAITRASSTDASGNSTARDVDIRGSAHSIALIPGLGVSAEVARPLTLYTGVHRGYAPPRTKDAVSPSGQNLQLDPELSWNTELGARLRLGRWFHADVAGFWLEFENQIIPPSESGGAVAASGFNTGHSRHVGVEASATFDLAPLAFGDGAPFALPLTVNYTWLPTADFVGGLFGGNRLPYAPAHTLYAQLRFVHRAGLSAQVAVNHVAAQFADKENTPFPSVDGLVGTLPAYTTVSARVGWEFRGTGITVYVAGNNLTDQIYIANRAPQGIQPAGFRQVFLGLAWNLSAPAAPTSSTASTSPREATPP